MPPEHFWPHLSPFIQKLGANALLEFYYDRVLVLFSMTYGRGLVMGEKAWHSPPARLHSYIPVLILGSCDAIS